MSAVKLTEREKPISSTATEALCTNLYDHTPCPDGYIQWHSWADSMSKTHRQERCSGCGLYMIWVPRARTAARALNGGE